MQIWKFGLPRVENQEFMLTIPEGSRILSVQNQKESLVLWAMVPDQPFSYESRKFYIATTCHLVPFEFEVEEFLGTVQFLEGSYVVHVFEIT
jgi:hypothetical protein